MIDNEELKKFFLDNQKAAPFVLKDVSSARGVLRESGAPYLPLDEIQIPFQEMFREAKNLEELAIPHRSYKEENKGWKSLVLHGLSSVHTQGAEQYGFDPEQEDIYTWTDLARFAPVTTEFFKTKFHYEGFQRIRFMYLEPGGYILPHRDTEDYFIGPTNISLNNPEGCDFVMENIGLVPFFPGRAIKLALCNKHAVWNRSQETRIHIIVHGSPDFDFWGPHFLRAYEALRKSHQ